MLAKFCGFVSKCYLMKRNVSDDLFVPVGMLKELEKLNHNLLICQTASLPENKNSLI